MGGVAPTCSLLAPDAAAALGIICAALALLVLAVIVLGFGPLRMWLGLGTSRRLPGAHLVGDAGGLRETWHLYREFRRVNPGHRDPLVRRIPGPVVPTEVVRPAQDT